MRILLATSRLLFEGGSEVWNLTMLRFLRLAGHEVDVFAIEGNQLTDDKPDFARPYDLALICHGATVEALRGKRIDRRIMICHGVAPHQEQPVSGCDRYVAVSENIQRHLRERGFSSEVIRNPVDCQLFNGAPENKRRRVAFMCSGNGAPLRAGAALTVEKACRDWEFQFLHSSRHHDLPRVLSGFDAVVGIGRCILEAAACQKSVISFDHGIGYGAVADETFAEYRRDSFSGLIAGKSLNSEELREEILRARPVLRPYVLAEHEGSLIARQFLALASRI